MKEQDIFQTVKFSHRYLQYRQPLEYTISVSARNEYAVGILGGT